MDYVYRYLIYLLSGVVLLLVFAVIYIRFTPYDEIALIRSGHTAAAFSFGGALVGFALTLAASAFFNASVAGFVGWAVAAMLVQLLAYLVMARVIPDLEDALEANNVAVGGFMGSVSLAIGIINAACLS
ncbi:MAG: DUF350 domain-containing protein [Pseudomonadota bacterium]|nr:DUF350 domain-containing protein [Pseudomonadota bacterium]